jgi:hypothetical protein
MAKLKVKKLEPVFGYKAGDFKVIVYTFDTDYANYFAAACVEDGPHDEEIFACGTYTDAQNFIEVASFELDTVSKAGEVNPFKTLLKDNEAMERLQKVMNYVVEGEWW